MFNNCGTIEAPKNVPVESPSIAVRINETGDNLTEANKLLSIMYNSVCGNPESKRVDTPPPPQNCMYDSVMWNLEQSHAILNQLTEINRRLFG